MKFYHKPSFKYGAKRIRKFFALLPFRCQDTTYWFESVEVCEENVLNTDNGRKPLWIPKVVLSSDPVFDGVNKELRRIYGSSKA